MSLLTLFLVFVKFGLLCVGGGYMLVPFLSSDLVEARHVLTAEQFTNLFSIAQVTPGPIGINAATYVGYLQQGITGAVIASIGLVFPSLILTTLAVHTLKRYEETFWVKGFLAGVRPATLGLILGTTLIFANMSIIHGELPFSYPFRWLMGYWQQVEIPYEGFTINWGAVAIFGVMLWLQLKKRITLTWLIVGSALAGILIA